MYNLHVLTALHYIVVRPHSYPFNGICGFTVPIWLTNILQIQECITPVQWEMYQLYANGHCFINIERIILKLNMLIDHNITNRMISLVYL